MGILAVFFAANLLFVVKYGTRAGIPASLGIAGYSLAFMTQCVAGVALAGWIQRSPRAGTWSVALLAAYAAAALALYLRMDPLALNVDRWSALEYFLDALFQGVFPWSVQTHLHHGISGFPGLFLLALPFYLLGDVGLMQFAALFALFALVVVRLRDLSRPVFLLVMLAGLPVFAYHLFCRSDLFGNLVAAAWLLHLGQRDGAARGFRIVLWGAAWGLMLSTRAVLLIPLILAAFALLQGRGLRAYAAFGLAVTATFFSTFMPFYIWDPELFGLYNPWNVQSVHSPRVVMALVLLITLWIGWKHRAGRSLFRDAGWILTLTVAACWIYRSFELGWDSAFWQHGFDVSYFIMGIPFLWIALADRLPKTFREHD